MAFSQVEVASSSTFGCVLRDHTRRNGYWDSHAKAAFQRNLKNLVRDHLHDSMTVSSDYLRYRNVHDHDHNSCQHQHADPWPDRQAEEQGGQQGAAQPLSSSYDSASLTACFNDISELGASSLVLIWEQRLTRSNSTNEINSVTPTRKSSSGNCNQEEKNKASATEERSDDHQVDGAERQGGWSDEQNDQPSAHSTQSEAEKMERVNRVADIIRRLSAGSEESNQDMEQSYACILYGQQAEQRMFTHRLIRGRQAIECLTMQMERDRNAELKGLAERAAVSKFTHRRRIQAMLRLKLLWRGVTFYDPPYQHSTRASEIIKRRERLNYAGSDHRNEVQITEPANANQRSIAREKANYNLTRSNSSRNYDSQRDHNLGHSVIRDDECEGKLPNPCDCQNNKHKAPMEEESVLSRKRVVDDGHENVEINIPTSSTPQEEASLGTSVEAKSVDHLKETAKATQNAVVPENLESQKVAEEPIPSTDDGCHGNARTCTEQEVDAIWTYDEMTEEIEDSCRNEGETRSHFEWMSDICRPRSFWESRRQDWYREMLHGYCSDKDQDIRQLIERRTVSNFLSSGLRERIDLLMVCHLGRQSILMENYEDGESNIAETTEQFIKFLQEYSPSGIHHEQNDRGENKEHAQQQRQEEEDEEHTLGLELRLSSICQEQHHEVSDDLDPSVSSPQVPSPSLVRSWSYKDDSYTTDHVDSERLPSSQRSQAFFNDNSRRINSRPDHHKSAEMELIYDLRMQMEKLHQEMAELRKSIKSCTDMQTSSKGDAENGSNIPLKKGSCRVCHERKVDTVLYRCGHMCACFKCANELRWRSGECPICRAGIVDVVRVLNMDD